MDDPMRHLPDGAKYAIDGLSLAATLGALVDWLPAIASLLTIIWTLIRIYETRSIQSLLGRPPRAGGNQCD